MQPETLAEKDSMRPRQIRVEKPCNLRCAESRLCACLRSGNRHVPRRASLFGRVLTMPVDLAYPCHVDFRWETRGKRTVRAKIESAPRRSGHSSEIVDPLPQLLVRCCMRCSFIGSVSCHLPCGEIAADFELVVTGRQSDRPLHQDALAELP